MALVSALRKQDIAGAALDVFEMEPAVKTNPLFTLDNVVVTPYMAAHTEKALQAMAVQAVKDILRVLRG